MRRTIHGCGSSTGSGVRSIRYAWALSNCAAPSYGLVSTAKRSGGSRRHHSHSNDWMPPIFGGKSFVTSRCFTRRDRRRADRRPSRAAAQRACSASTLVVAVAVPLERRHDPRSSRVGRVAEDDERVAPQPARVAAGDVPAPVAVEQRLVVGGEQVEHVDPRLGVGRQRRWWRRPRWTVGGHASWQSSQPYRRSPTAGRSSTGMAPGRCSTQARQRLASMTPGATMAPVGQASRHRWHVPQPSATGASAAG